MGGNRGGLCARRLVGYSAAAMMRAQPVHYFADPNAERDRRMLFFVAGFVLGGLLGVVVASLLLFSP